MLTRFLKISARPLLAATLLAASACDFFTGPDEARLDIALPAEIVGPGAVVTVEVTNRSDRTWYTFDYCASPFQRQIGGAWQDVYPVVCLAFLAEASPSRPLELSVAPITIEPGEAVQISFYLPSEADEGLHRVKIRFIDSVTEAGREATRFSPAFLVRTNSLGAK